LPALTSILLRLAANDPGGAVAEELSSDAETVGNLIRAAAVLQEVPSDRSNVSALLFVLAFSKALSGQWTDDGGSVLVPKLIGARYKVPHQQFFSRPNSSVVLRMNIDVQSV
jgi:hypothetical protein